MVAGALGVVTTLLVYSLLFNFLSPINLSFFADHFNNHSLFNGYEKTFVNNADWLVKQTYNALGNFGHGKHTLAVTFIYPSLYKRVKIHSKSSTRRHQSKALGLIIMICLLLSGDIHPCPSPHHANPVNVLDFTLDSAVSQVRTLGRGTLLSGHVQQTNLPCFGSPGFGGGVLPALSAVTSGEVVEAQRLGTSIMDRRHIGPVDSRTDPATLQVRTFGGGMSLSGYAQHTNLPRSVSLDAGVGAGSVAAEEAELPGVSTAAVGVPRHVHVGLLASESGLGSRAASGSDTDFQPRSCITRPEGNLAPMESPNSSISVNSGLGTSQVSSVHMF